jgi:hypothetical protein
MATFMAIEVSDTRKKTPLLKFKLLKQVSARHVSLKHNRKEILYLQRMTGSKRMSN